MGDARQPPRPTAPPTPPADGQPDFVLRDDGELVATRDVAAAETGSLVGDLVLEAAPPARPEDAVRAPARPPEAPRRDAGDGGRAPAAPPRPRPGAIPRAATDPAQRFGAPPPRRPPPGPARAPEPPPPRYATPDGGPIPEAQVSATPTLMGTPLPDVAPPARAPAGPRGPAHPTVGGGRSPPPPPPRIVTGTGDTGPVSSNDIEIELDDRSLADIAFESSTNLPVLGSGDLDEPRRGPPPPPRPAPPAPHGSALPSVTGVGPTSSPTRGPATGGPSRPGQPTPGAFQPRAQGRPVRERSRGVQNPIEGPPAGNEPGLNLNQKAELLYREALKEAAVGNVAAARRHLQLALSFAPRHPQYTRALQSLKAR